ncbi:MAG: class I SAM-dependent methyltransferase [Candidatus Sulfotelmatobacter sp.]
MAYITFDSETSNMSRPLENLFFRRPRVLNLLHWANLINPTSQTIAVELDALERYAAGARQALEIGTYQGVSAVRIARALAPGGLLYCVDPWPEVEGKKINPCLSICERNLRRSGVKDRIRILRGYSRKMASQMPDRLDFAFVDGDHSWEGIKTDWMIVSEKVLAGGVVCLHDSFTPAGEDWRHPDSCAYFEKVIQNDARFCLIEVVHSLAVLRKTK